ncbi:hypothetical protein TRBR_21490 [Treponema bryantii]|nr:hypothetical protein TRBR_21490 [Treponema bryantii]
MRRAFVKFSGRMKKGLLFFVVVLAFCHAVVAQSTGFSWDFADCEIKDILFAVSMDTGISIVPDDTVSGKGDLKFAGGNFDLAFESFLRTNRLFVKRDGSIWTVSRIQVSVENGLFSVEAYDLLPVQIIEKLSEVMDKVVTFETLPAQRISVCFKGVDETVLMDCLAKRFGVYDVVQDDAGYHFVKKTDVRGNGVLRNDVFSGMVKIEMLESGAVSVDVEDCSFSVILNRLFENESYCLLSDGESKIQRSVFVGSDFKDTLSILCSQCGFDFVYENGIYYIFAKPSVREELISGKRTWRKFTLRFTKSQDFLTFVYKRVGKLEILPLPDEFSFLCYASESETAAIEELMSEADIKLSTYVVNLKYLKPSEFLEHLPPAVERSSLFMADDSARLYFKGTEEAYKVLCEQLEVCDKPAVRLSYDLLILQYDETVQNNWTSSFGVKRLTVGDRNGVSAVLGSVMGFNLNVVTAFGLTFAAELQGSIEENKARVYADTTLHGVSGREIHFENTNTYRYRDNNVDPETGKPIYSGVTREIASGIKLDVLGWVSGDGMITSKVTASVSRRGNDTSGLTGNPPPTSEKLVTTEVCSKSGEPVVLSGLVQTAESEQQKRSPLISKIPIIGNLFKNKNSIQEKMQMVIYLVPHITGGEAFEDAGNGTEDLAWAKESLWNLLADYSEGKFSKETGDEQKL